MWTSAHYRRLTVNSCWPPGFQTFTSCNMEYGAVSHTHTHKNGKLPLNTANRRMDGWTDEERTDRAILNGFETGRIPKAKPWLKYFFYYRCFHASQPQNARRRTGPPLGLDIKKAIVTDSQSLKWNIFKIIEIDLTLTRAHFGIKKKKNEG